MFITAQVTRRGVRSAIVSIRLRRVGLTRLMPVFTVWISLDSCLMVVVLLLGGGASSY